MLIVPPQVCSVNRSILSSYSMLDRGGEAARHMAIEFKAHPGEDALGAVREPKQEG